MTITLCETDEAIRDCYPVVVQLRPHLLAAEFVDRIRLQQREGYRLAAVRDDFDRVTAAAGFRILTYLFRGRTLYVDDLVTDEKRRSEQFGHQLFQWLLAYAKSKGCEHLELDSGVQRFDAHRFYLRERMAITAHHFGIKVPQ